MLKELFSGRLSWGYLVRGGGIENKVHALKNPNHDGGEKVGPTQFI